MPRDVAIVFVHGIYAESINYADPMRAALLRKIPKQLRQHVEFQPVFWAQAVRHLQQQFLDRACNQCDLPRTELRRFLVEGLGDAAAYQKTRNRVNSAYYDIQDCVARALKSIDRPEQADRPLIFIGHSLGCHIVSSYAWDINRLKQVCDADLEKESDQALRTDAVALRAGSPFKRLDTFAAFITMGSNMPLFTFTFGPERVYPITGLKPELLAKGLKPAFPGRALPPNLLNKARWLNFYSNNDVMGFPLKPLNPVYHKEKRLEDIHVRTESALSMFSPMQTLISAHTGYWTNPTVVSRTAALIQDIIEAPA